MARGKVSGQGSAPCTLALLGSIGTKEPADVGAVSNPLSLADKWVIGRRNLFFRAWIVKVQEQSGAWSHV